MNSLFSYASPLEVRLCRAPKKILLLLIFLLVASDLHGAAPQELADRAQADYQAGRYAEAVQTWEDLVKMGFVNGDIYANIANAYWRLGQVGEARRYYLTAEHWSPRDPHIRESLALVEAKLEPASSQDGPLVLLRKIPWYRLALNFQESLVACAVFSCLLCLFLFLYLLNTKKRWAWTALFLALPLLYCLGYLWKGLPSERAIVIGPKAALRETPAATAAVRETLAEGSLLQIKKTQGDFALVQKASGQTGWIETEQIGALP
ncbi:MAG TPA: hypothetical protein DF383_01775 [Deltaproteobacteria bacterium]|nr:hypothetical protein [Deltaproteobacteria bacterium]